MNFNKLFRYSLFAVLVIFLTACSKKDDIIPNADLEGLKLATTLSNENHNLSVYTGNGKFLTGYNQIYFQIKNKDGSLVTNATATWAPTMQMTNMNHSCPASSIVKKGDSQTTYEGFIVFQMPSNSSEFWSLKINYTINGVAYSVLGKLEVEGAPKRNLESFQGTDGKKYVMALVQPTAPSVALNDISVVLYRMESMMNFTNVDGFKIKLDPRMPGMGNHTSPNNVDLGQGKDGKYHGKLSLTMTGYWKINLQLENNMQQVIKGEAVTTTNESSSIFFELEF